MRFKTFGVVLLFLGFVLISANPASAEGDVQAVIYGQPRCRHSLAAVEHFKSATYYDVSKDEERLREMLKLSDGKSVTPVLVVNGAVFIGYLGKT